LWRICGDEIKHLKIYNSILFNERLMMAITREDDFVSRAVGEWRNSSERKIAIIREYNTYTFPTTMKRN
jgi:hypothetical protein